MSYTLTYNGSILVYTKTGGDNDIIQIPIGKSIIHSIGDSAYIVWNYHEGTNVFGSNSLQLKYDECTSPTYANIGLLLGALLGWQELANTSSGSTVTVDFTPYSSVGTIINATVGTTAEQVTITSTPSARVLITANHSNGGRITVGDSAITDGNGVILYAADTVEFNIDNVNKLYVVASVGGEDITATYFN